MEISSSTSAFALSERAPRTHGESRAHGRDAEEAEKTSETNQPSNQQLDEEEQAQVSELERRDREVRAHEAAHLAAAGAYAQGGAEFTYERGPNGQQYAVGGEVSIDTSAIAGDPQATLQKALQVQRAALAPADPSGQDRKVAAEAASMAAKARQESLQSTETELSSPTSADQKQADRPEHSREQANGLLQRIRQRGALDGATTASLHLVA